MHEPDPPSGRIVLEAPPSLEPREGVGAILSSAVPMLGSLGSVVLVATMATQSGAGGHRSLMAAGCFLLGTLGFVAVQLDRQRSRRRQQQSRSRHGYLRHLADVRARVHRASGQQREALRREHPPPAALPARAEDRSGVWQRRPTDGRALLVRYAEARQPLSVDLVRPEVGAVEEPDPVATAALDRLLAAHREVPDLPLLLDLVATGRVDVAGDREAGRSLARAMVCSAATRHPPTDLVVAVLVPPEALDDWRWLGWLPHAHSRRRHDAVGGARCVATSPDALAPLLADPGPDAAHVLLVVDGAAPPPARPGLTVVALRQDPAGPPSGEALRLHAGSDGGLRVEVPGAGPTSAVADRCDPATAEAVARRLLPLDVRGEGPAGDPGLLALLDERASRPDGPRDLLRVPIGVGEDGRPVHLDLKESAHGGVGPHGLLVGATGSGKSELLRTLVLGLALTHPPDVLEMVLVDFKGGATFAGLAPLPHVAGTVTNLADDLTLVDRVQDALAGELVRRQEVLRAAGRVASVRDLDRARAAGADLPALPSLLVVVDEFAEMLAARPGFLDVFTAIGRLGRSLGLHLLLASQRLEEGRLRGLESHLSYRIGLRTFSSAESRAVLGVPDAASLPPVPGSGFLRTGPGDPVRFRASYVSGATPPPTARPAVLPFTLEEVPLPEDPPGPPAAGPSVLEEAVARLSGRGPRARQVWLPPLDEPAVLGPLLKEVATAGLVLPLGAVDRPREQRRDPLLVDLTGAGGHVAVVGAPRSGRTTLLQTLAAALALTHSPEEVRLLLVDLAGGGLAPLAGMPHVVAHATGHHPDVVRRVVAELRDLLDRRETGTGDRDGEVFLLVDGWSRLRAGHDELESEIQQVAARGLAHGVHVVVAADRWADLRAAMRDLVGTRLELRLGDPLDSEVDRRAARAVPQDRPGRGLTPEGHHFLAALPGLDGSGLEGLVARVAAAWPATTRPRLRPLPERVALADVPSSGAAAGLLLGVDERLAPVTLDPGTDPHTLVLGGPGSGRTATLRTLLHEVVRSHPPDRAQVVLLDPRRSLLGEVPEAHLLGHHGTGAAPALAELADHMQRRLPGPEVTREQLRARSWWSGAEVFVVVDDHELATLPGEPPPLAPLLPLLPRAADVGLHLLLATGTGVRALHDPAVQALRGLASPTLLLPGDPTDGPVVGRLTAVLGPPGRARLVVRGGVRTLQVAWTEPAG